MEEISKNRLSEEAATCLPGDSNERLNSYGEGVEMRRRDRSIKMLRKDNLQIRGGKQSSPGHFTNLQVRIDR